MYFLESGTPSPAAVQCSQELASISGQPLEITTDDRFEMPPLTPMAVSLNPTNFNFATWLSSLTGLSGAPLDLIGVSSLESSHPDRVVPVPPAAPIHRHIFTLSDYRQVSIPHQWRQLLAGDRNTRATSTRAVISQKTNRTESTEPRPTEQRSVHLRPRTGTQAPIKRPPSSQPQRPELPRGHRRPSLHVPIENIGPGPHRKRRMATQPITSPAIQQLQPSLSNPTRASVESRESRFERFQEPSQHFLRTIDRDYEASVTKHPNASKADSLPSLQYARPAIDRSRLWDFKITKFLFESRAGVSTSHAADFSSEIPISLQRTAQKTDVTTSEHPITEAPTRGEMVPAVSHKDLPRPEATSRTETTRTRSASAGAASIMPLFQEIQESRLGHWFKQLVTAPRQPGADKVPASIQEAIRFTDALRKSEAPYAALKSELARIDGELRSVPLPHILPNMGEIDSQTLFDLMNQGGANPQGTPSTEDCGRWDPELVKQVRHALTAAGYCDVEGGPVRKLENAADGKALLHFLSHLARNPLARYGLSLIDMINLVNETIGYGPFLKQKDINGTIRSMDPKRWGKDSEVLLHPLMGRANLVINVLDLIESNRITMPEVLDLLRIGTDGDILERLEVELEAAHIYRNDLEWWRDLWKGQDAESLRPWFDNLISQIRGAIDDLKDVLTFVASVENEAAAALV